MFRRIVLPANQPAPAGSSESQPERAPIIEGFVYCAARNVHELAHLAATAEDADRVLRSLANLECIARATASPKQDLIEIESWRVEAERRVESVRAPRASMLIGQDIMHKRRVTA